ncbi:hypothetical protein MTR67_051902 [Solanum verrucosum]|uniref:Uncharacterized protein n=1 Tax=Solanum verrucosum TaxID=315347 RepID=A0AAF0ZZI2_SOLVR|nr:hypothetical protein MTR67_051902 [Solanum verrucosum]
MGKAGNRTGRSRYRFRSVTGSVSVPDSTGSIRYCAGPGGLDPVSGPVRYRSGTGTRIFFRNYRFRSVLVSVRFRPVVPGSVPVPVRPDPVVPVPIPLPAIGMGIEVDPKKTDTVKSWPRLLSPTDIRSFLGLAGYYRRFV